MGIDFADGWGEDRFEIRRRAEAIDVNKHLRCKECGSRMTCGASWMWGGIKGKDKPYFARCSGLGCRYVRPPFWGDTPQEAVQKWDEEMTKKHTHKVTYEVVTHFSVNIAAENEDEACERFKNMKMEHQLPGFSDIRRSDWNGTKILTVEDIDTEDKCDTKD